MKARHAVAAALIAIAMPAWAQDAKPQVNQQNGIRYVQGGVGEEEREFMRSIRRDYNFEAIFAAKGGGNFLADVDLAVRDSKGNEVLQARIDAPILFAQLPPGRYTVEATYEGKTQKRAVTVPAKGRVQTGLYFDDVSVQEQKYMEPPERSSTGASRRWH